MTQPAHARIAPAHSPSKGRIICGWCDRLVALDPTGATRHVTCDDCRDLAARLNQRDVAVVAPVPVSARQRKP